MEKRNRREKEMIKVSVVKCNSYDKREVKKALLSSLKNINFELKENQKVLIKPNVLAPEPPEKAIDTHPVIIEELCKILKQKKADICIGDSSGTDTDSALKVSGISRLKKYGKILNFEREKKKIFYFSRKFNRVYLPEIALKSDLVINVAKMKTHGLTKVTLCIKNLYGCIPGKLKENYHRLAPSPREFSKLLLFLHEKIKPELNIIDGIIGLEGDGPSAGGKLIKSKVLLASKNALAIDVVASEIMGFKSREIVTNKLGRMKRKNIEVVGNGKNIRLSFEKPSSFSIPLLLWMSNLLPKPRIKFDKSKCKKCGICRKKCPAKAITLSPYPEVNNRKCIRCLCCIEVCPYNSPYVEYHPVVQIIVRIFKFLKII
ncbi:MAG: DUF362 domain-containing protein [Nanoarchaeota archaeon]